MSTQRKLIVRLDPKSRKSLHESGYSLDIFKGSRCGNGEMHTNVIASISKDLGTQNTFTWIDSYAGYTSPIDKEEKVVNIKSVTALDMELGDLYVLSADGDASINSSGGKENYLEIHNKDDSRGAGYCFGIGNNDAENQPPVCVVSIPGQSTVSIEPKNKYLVTFSSEGAMDPNVAIVEISTSAGVCSYEDDTTEREVWFNYSTGRWAETEKEAAKPISDEGATITNGWFDFIKVGVGVLNKVLNG